MSVHIKLPRTPLGWVLTAVLQIPEAGETYACQLGEKAFCHCQMVGGDGGRCSGLSLRAEELQGAVLVHMTGRVGFSLACGLRSCGLGFPVPALCSFQSVSSLLRYLWTDPRTQSPPCPWSPRVIVGVAGRGRDGGTFCQFLPKHLHPPHPRCCLFCIRNLLATPGKTTRLVRECYYHRLGGKPEAPRDRE